MTNKKLELIPSLLFDDAQAGFGKRGGFRIAE